MTRFWLIMLRIICILQTLIAVVRCFTSLFGLLMNGGFMLLLQAIAFGFMAALPILTLATYNNNYPDKPVEGRQKKYFNRIFLINFLLIAFLFGFVFRDYHDAILQSGSLDSVSGPLVFFIPFIISCCILIFHFSVLYGLYWLRRQINNNVSSKQFDFEDENV